MEIPGRFSYAALVFDLDYALHPRLGGAVVSADRLSGYVRVPAEMGVCMVLYLVVIALCTMLAMMGRATEEIVLGTLASVVFIVLWLVAWRFAKRFFSEYRDEALSAEERDYVARHPTAPDAMTSRVIKPGDWIGVGSLTGRITDITWRSTM